MPVQRVRRVIRKIDPWTMLKVSFVFNAIMALVLVLGIIIFWSVFVNAGFPDKINDLLASIGWEGTIEFDGPTYFRIVMLFAIIGTILFTGLATLAAVVYNLISDLVGGIEVVVLEETAVPHVSRPVVTLPVTKAPAPPRIRPLPTVDQNAEADAPTTEPEVTKTGS